MAGFVTVFNEKMEGTVNIGSRSLDTLFVFLIEFKAKSPILVADHSFDPKSDQLIGEIYRSIDLSKLCDHTLAEIGRLLMEACDPSHPFWANDALLFNLNILEERRQEGKDVDAEVQQWKSEKQTAFRQVAELIHQRVDRMHKNG
jgi:hypothetical protein